MPLSNAERQKRYRDRKRAGPPRGRWAGYVSMAKTAEQWQLSRTRLFMARWIRLHAPDVAEQMAAGGSGLKTTPLYNRLKAEYEAGIFRAAMSRPAGNVRLVESRKDGRFVFQWVRASKRK